MFFIVMTALSLKGAAGADVTRIDKAISESVDFKSIERINTSVLLGKNIDVYGSAEEPWFKAKDVADWIEHSDASKMVKNIDEDEKGTKIVPTLGGNQKVLMLTEDGLYEVLMQSRKPIAKQFKKGVKRILKELRRNGTVTTNAVPRTYLESLKALVKAEEEKERLALENKQQQFLIEEKAQQLDESKEWYTIKRWAKTRHKNWRSYSWRKLKALSYELGYTVKKIFDANYGEVNIYHRNVFACYENV